MAGHPIDITIGATLSGTLGAAVSGAKSQLNQLGSTISNLSQQQAGVGRLTNLRGQAAQSARAMRDAQGRVRAAQAAVNAAGPGGATATQNRELERATNAANRAEQAYRRQRTAVDQLSQSLQQAGVNTRSLGSEQQRIGSQLELVRTRTEALTRATQAQARNMESRANYRGQMLDAAALGMAMAAPIKKAAEFEQAMANVGAVAKASDEDLGKLTKQARELGAATNWSASQAAEGMKYLAMAGFSTEQTLAAMPGMLNLASAGAIELGDAADIASNILTGFGIEAGQMGRVGDILTATFTSSNTTLQSLGATMKYVAPIAASTGTSIETIAAMTGKLGDAGIQGEMAGTALRAMLTRLSAPTDKAAGLLKELGVTTTDAQGNLRPMVEVLKELEASMTRLGSADKAEAVAKIFGVEAASAATVLMAQAASGEIDKMAQSITREGTAAEVAAKQNATTIGAMKRLGSAVESMAISIGSVLLLPLAQLSDKLAPIIGGIAAWAEAHPVLTTALVGTLAGAIALKIATVGLGYAFTFIKGPILAANTAIAAVRAQMALISVGAAASSGPLASMGAAFTRAAAGARALGLALVANPVGLTIAAIGAAAVGLALVIRKYWEPLSAWVSGFFQGIGAAIQPAMAGISAAFAPIKAAFEPLSPVFSALGSALSGVVGWFGSLLSPVQLTGAEFDGFVSKGQAVGAVLGGAINTGLQVVTPILQTLGSLIGMVIQGWTMLGQMAVQAWNTIVSVFQNNAPLAALQQLGSQLVGALAGLPGQFMAIGSQIISGLISGIKAKIGSAIAAAGEAVSGVINGAKAKLGIKSPSRVFAEMGENVNAGMAQGLIRSGTIAVRPVEQLAARMGSVPFGLQGMQPPGLPGKLPGLGALPFGALPSPMAAAPTMAMAAQPIGQEQPALPMTAKPITAPATTGAGAGASSGIHFSPQITVNAGAMGGDPDGIAQLIETRLRGMFRDTLRGNSASMFD